MEYETVIGLEVHVQLKTKTKAFCGCSTEFGKDPNSQVCPVCLGFPGSLPVLNKVYLQYAIKVALAFNCKVQEYTKFDRKNYFYPDLPKNYQISQYDLPLSRQGFLDVDLDGKIKRIGILRVHMEEDAGKLIHKEDSSSVDFNRSGMPLLEIVSDPDMSSPQEAYEYLTILKSVLEYLDVSDCDMEKGTLRCDANVSIRKPGDKKLGTKTELKNLNSFRAVRDSLAYEVKRQAQLLDEEGLILQETRLWDSKDLKTVSMRTKEGAQDYRYFPEPDLPPFIIDNKKIEEIRQSIPELPRDKMLRFMEEFNLSKYDSKVLTSSRKDADFSEECIKLYAHKDKKSIVNWIIGPLLSEANARNIAISQLHITPNQVVELVGYLDRDELSNLSAKSANVEMIDTGASCQEIIKKNNLMQTSNVNELENVVIEVINENHKSVLDYKSGKENAVMFLVGQAMKKSKGKANPKVIQELLKRRLSDA